MRAARRRFFSLGELFCADSLLESQRIVPLAQPWAAVRITLPSGLIFVAGIPYSQTMDVAQCSYVSDHVNMYRCDAENGNLLA